MQRSSLTLRFYGAACALLVGVIPAQSKGSKQSDFQVALDSDSVSLSVDPDRGMSMKDFIGLAERVTGKSFVYERRDVENDANRIVFLGTVKRTWAGFYEFVKTMLYTRGLTCVESETRSPLVEIYSHRGQRITSLSIGATYVAAESLAHYQTQSGVRVLTLIPLEHLDAKDAAELLRPFFSIGRSSLQIGCPEGTHGSLPVEGSGRQVFQAYRLLRHLDVQGAAGRASSDQAETAGRPVESSLFARLRARARHYVGEQRLNGSFGGTVRLSDEIATIGDLVKRIAFEFPQYLSVTAR